MAEYFIGITDKGRRREKNEDTFIAQKVLNKELLVACVIDGVGGYSGGEVAAAIARSVMLQHLQNLSGDIIVALQNAVIAANAKIYHEKSSDKNENMACVLTCAVADIKNNKLYYAHVGDTRLYLLRDNSLVKISKDHSAVGFLEETGRLSEEDAMRHPRRNEINKALGFEEQVSIKADYIETGESPFLPGDTILLCSDGLSDMVSSAGILSILNKNKSLAERAKELIDAANGAGGNDNITVVLVENTRQPQKQVALKPVERKAALENSKPAAGKASSRQIPSKVKKGSKAIGFFAVLSFVLLIALGFSLLKNTATPKKSNAAQQMMAPKAKDEKLARLILQINDTAKMYAIPAGDSLLKITDAIAINKDSFHLQGNGATIEAEANYKGPAFTIGHAAKHIVLENLLLKNFDVALIVQKNNIVFKNVRFINCRVPVQYMLSFADSVVNGRFKDSIFINNSNLK